MGVFAVGLLFFIASLTRTIKMRTLPTPAITLYPYQSTATPQVVSTQNEFEITPAIPTTSQVSQGGDFLIGDLVEVHGTGGEGLRLRNAPSLASVVNELAMENEVLEIRGGPTEADGYIWWFLINPYDNQRQGWGVGVYIRELNP